jgi:hypothetical protein
MQSFRGQIINKVNNPTFVQFEESNLKHYSTLDLFIASEGLANRLASFEVLARSAVHDPRLDSYHMPVICEFNIEITRRKKNRCSFHASYLYNKTDWRQYVNEVERALFEEPHPFMNLESKSEWIVNAFKNAANKHIPKSKEHKSRISNFPPDIKRVLSARNYWGRQYKKYRNKHNAKMYQDLQEHANDLIAKFKLAQWHEFLERQGPNPLSSVPFWKRINRLRASKRTKNVNFIRVNDELTNDGKIVANAFGDELEKKFSLDENHNYDNETKENIKKFFDENTIENSFSRHQKVSSEFSAQELANAIENMNAKTSLDPMGISNRMLKHCGDVTKGRLLDIFNQCLKERRVPGSWKHSVVTMLHKNGLDTNLVASYRPISLTPCIARLFERLLLSRLNKILKSKNIMIKNQSGFRKDRQTRDNILHLIQKTQEGFNKDEKTLAIFFDIAGAFDKVWHDGLIFKLFKIGVPYYLLVLFKDFLSNRTFVVKINGSFSSIRPIACGVPQGGVLSPTFFSYYINDVPLASGANETTLLFADDIVYRLSFQFREKNRLIPGAKEEAQKMAQTYLRSLENWMNTWRLSLAPRKCAHIIFSKAKNIKNDAMDLRIYNETIPFDVSPKFLGIVFDQRLKFDQHLKSVIKKVNDRLNILKVLSYDSYWCLDEKTLVRIYMALIRSVLDYCCVISGAGSKEVFDKFEVIQNSALRIIFKISLLDHVRNETLLERAKLTSIAERHRDLLERYYEKCLISSNPLINDLFDEYNDFKKRHFINENVAVKEDGSVDLDALALIRIHNKKSFDRGESYPTTLCKTTSVVKVMIIGNYAPGEAIR